MSDYEEGPSSFFEDSQSSAGDIQSGDEHEPADVRPNDDILADLDGPADDPMEVEPKPDHTPHSTPSKRLFLPDSDEEEDNKLRSMAIHSHAASSAASSDVDDVPATSSPPYGRTPSVEPMAPPIKVEEPRKTEPPKKKRRLGTPSRYIGTFLVYNAFATTKGKGYAKNGDPILIERDKPKSASTRKASDKIGVTTKDGKKKQQTLTSMMKAPSNFSRKPVDTTVRISNARGFEFARLPQEVALWVSKLLDQDMVEFRNCTLIDCPVSLQTGVDLVVSLSAYLKPAAFKRHPTSGEDSHNMPMFSEGQESLDERVLRDRKGSLLRLFNAVSMRPARGVAMNDAALKNTPMSQEPAPPATKDKGKQETIPEETEDDSEVLSEKDLKMIYRKAQKNDTAMAEMEPVDTFVFTLRSYQKQALMWMHSLETGVMSAREASSLHPLWNEYIFPSEPVDGVVDLTDSETPFYLNPYSGELSLEFPKAEQKCKGGILADEMGMGKTIMLSALIHTSRTPEAPATDLKPNAKRKQTKLNAAFSTTSTRKDTTPAKGPSATLIVAPTSLLTQWSDELNRSSKDGTTQIVVWHGQNRSDLDALLDHDDEEGVIKIIITSYGVLASEHARSSGKTKSPIYEIEWLRVILDEAHHCKSRTSKTARAVFDLQARRRWAVTGTPIVNRLEDLFSLLKFLGFNPWNEFSFFRSFITIPFLAHDPKAIEVVQVILESILLRREKTMRDGAGNLIVSLPEKQIVVEKLQFSGPERKTYDEIYFNAKRNYQELNAKGLIGKNYTHILAMLMRLRRAVLHTSLVSNAASATKSTPSDPSNGVIDVDSLMDELEGASATFAKETLQNLQHQSTSTQAVKKEGEEQLEEEAEVEVEECPICLDVMDAPMIIPGCMHKCCKDCITSYMATCEEKGEPRKCPTCSSGPFEESDLMEVVRHNASGSSEPSIVVLRRNDFRPSTKLDALISHLQRLRDQDPCFRAVVFSQFTSFLDLIETALERAGFEHLRFDGSMDMKKRGAALEAFKEPTRTAKVLAISLKAGGVGLNLTTANHVFMMDCWWNAAIEQQAVDRVHRIGQEKTVYVTHFIVSQTIEERILKIQKRKTAIIKEAFKGSGDKQETESMENLRIMFDD